ncbi:hypothetical protein, partial [Gordonia amarae]|uniref:hypothetical protein n=1 Tax=Gordonia amarae TaxID=36821 RepID=UPI001B8B353E
AGGRSADGAGQPVLRPHAARIGPGPRCASGGGPGLWMGSVLRVSSGPGRCPGRWSEPPRPRMA